MQNQVFKFKIQAIQNPGIVIRIAMVLERRAYSIQSLKIKKEAHDGLCLIHLKAEGSEQKKEQIIKQLSRLVDVFFVTEVSQKSYQAAIPLEALASA